MIRAETIRALELSEAVKIRLAMIRLAMIRVGQQ